MIERRKEQRVVSTFKSAYVRSASGIHFVTLRNVSESGICFDAYPEVKVGDEIEFCFNCGQLQPGVVKWVENGRFGVQAEVGNTIGRVPGPLRPRSVRLPLMTKADLFANGHHAQVSIHNLSLRGTCIDAVAGLSNGQLVSLRIGGRSFELATVRWQSAGKAGICFATPVAPREFTKLVRTLQDQTSNAPQGDLTTLLEFSNRSVGLS